jgi:hypothetical protein
MLPYIQNSSHLTLFVANRPYTVRNTAPNYSTILEKLEAGDEEGFEELLESPVIKAIQAFPAFEVKNGTLLYQGRPQQSYLSQKIMQMIEANKPVEPALRHFVKTQNNPSNRVVEELFRFMEQNDMPIVPNGNFLAYKRVNENYTDVHSSTYQNHIGAVLKMPRNQVDDNPNNTCSHGLHVCSFNYLSSFGGTRIVVCEVNPEHVVAIPTDYDHTKMRVCEYKVVGEIPIDTATHIWAEQRLIETYADPEDKDEDDGAGSEEDEEYAYDEND